ncbi:MAG: YggT family protein [bacterium]|nr:YggT family protein [bacterium]
MDSYNSPTTKPLYRGTQIIWYILGILEALMMFRFVLKLLGANSAAGFTSFIYTITTPIVTPFLSVFRISKVGGSIFEWTTLLAMLVYLLIAWAIIKFFVMSKTVSTPEAAAKLEEKDK